MFSNTLLAEELQISTTSITEAFTKTGLLTIEFLRVQDIKLNCFPRLKSPVTMGEHILKVYSILRGVDLKISMESSNRIRLYTNCMYTTESY